MRQPRRHATTSPLRTGTRPPSELRSERTGAVLVLVVVLLTVLLTMVAFTVDLGQMTMLRTELQNGVDAGTLAAQLQLQADPSDAQKAKDAAKEFVRLNQIGSKLVPKDAITVEVGTWDDGTGTFLPTAVGANSVHVFARQDNHDLAFGRITGQPTFGAPASAIATGSSSTVDIMMTLDLSGSMLYQGRIDALRSAAPAFVELIDEMGTGDQMGFMGLSADPSKFDPDRIGPDTELYDSGLHPTDQHHVGVLERRLTSDLPSLLGVLGGANLRASKYQGWTGTGAALGDSVHYIVNGAEARSGVKKIIVLMSDGHANRPPGNGPGYAEQMADYAAANKVVVYTISLGNSADEKLMQSIADKTGGEHFLAKGVGVAALTPTLTKAFTGIAGEIKSTRLVK